MHTDYKLLRIQKVTAILDSSRASIYSRMDAKSPYFDPTFPKPIKLSDRPDGRGAVAWIESELNAWIAARMAKRA